MSKIPNADHGSFDFWLICGAVFWAYSFLLLQYETGVCTLQTI